MAGGGGGGGGGGVQYQYVVIPDGGYMRAGNFAYNYTTSIYPPSRTQGLPADLSFEMRDTSGNWLGKTDSAFPEAKQRAQKLLEAHLTERQAKDLLEHEAFVVNGSQGGRYAFDMTGHGGFRLRITDSSGWYYCIYPQTYAGVPAYYYPGDNALACMLTLRTDEPRFLATAITAGTGHVHHLLR